MCHAKRELTSPTAPRLPALTPLPLGCNRQSHDEPGGLTYMHSIKNIIKKDGGGVRGVLGVLGRGLGGRVAASALQVKALGLEHDGTVRTLLVFTSKAVPEIMSRCRHHTTSLAWSG